MRSFPSVLFLFIHLGIVAFFSFSILSLGGCSTKSQPEATQHSRTDPVQISKTKQTATQKNFLEFYDNWKGTPHRLGGLSKRGIDCSGLVHIAYKDIYAMPLPRSTKKLQHEGVSIRRKQLSVGDLVFFKTGAFGRHVGIYLGDDSFLHSSKSKGVMISNLSERYWSSHYWKARSLTR